MEQLLEKRLHYFLNSPYRDRAPVRQTIRELRSLGRLAIVGGMLRDIALLGNANFASDLDFVIDPYDQDRFDRYIKMNSGKINRFGGYSLPPLKWRIDIWALRQTWAHREGHVRITSMSDLQKATFFNCDAIIYDFDNKKVRHGQKYFHDLEHRALEVNLLPNPNPMGNFVRAVRYALIKGFRWKASLVDFAHATIHEYGWDKLIEYEKRSCRTSYLEIIKHSNFDQALYSHLREKGNNLFDPSSLVTWRQIDFLQAHR